MKPRPSLASRLALAIGAAVAIVIAAAGILVAVGVIGRFDVYLQAAHMERYRQAAVVAAELVARRGGLDLRPRELRELAVAAGGPLEIRDPSGAVVARIDSLPGIAEGPEGVRPRFKECVRVDDVVRHADGGQVVGEQAVDGMLA
jgi:hypothetical protein